MNLSRKSALCLLAMLLALLLFGTQMPGAWRDEAFRVTHLPWQLTKVAHFVLFTLMAGVAHARPLQTAAYRVVLGALALAVVSEGLQFFASNRNPSLHDMAIDLAGAAVGLVLVAVLGRKNTQN